MRISDWSSDVCSSDLGVTVSTASGTMNFTDDRFFAGLLLSPQGVGIMGLTADSWTSVSKPLMVTAGGMHRDATGQEPARKIDPFSLDPAGNKPLAWWEPGTQQMYTGPGNRRDRAEGLLSRDGTADRTALLVA